MSPALQKRLSTFQQLNETEAAALKNLGQSIKVAEKGQMLLPADCPADRTILIHSGWATIYRDLSDGRRQIMQFCLPGDLVDPCSLLVSRRDFAIASISPIQYSEVSLADLTQVISEHPQLALPLLWNEARDIYLLRRHLLSIGRMTAMERLAALFLELADRLATAGFATNGSFILHATQKMLGDATGLSAVHVSRTMRAMEDERLIERSGHNRLTIDRHGLQQLIPDLLMVST
jgi:CRP/FNR family transcriptional regulator